MQIEELVHQKLIRVFQLRILRYFDYIMALQMECYVVLMLNTRSSDEIDKE